MNYDCSNLVNLYYDEAARCLEAGCPFASISMYWSTVEYAVEHELRGGSFVPLRPPIKYEAVKIKEKFEAFFGLFPKLQQYNDLLLRLYAYRNTYLHAKLNDLVHEPISEIESCSAISLESKTSGMKFDRPLGASWLIMGEPSAERSPAEQEVYLIGTAPIIATECRQLVDEFLEALAKEVRL